MARYYHDIVADMDAGNIKPHLPAIDPEATVQLFGMENFRGPKGAAEALRQWRESFPGLEVEMSEFINPDETNVLCIGRIAGGGASSGAAVAIDEFVFRIKIVRGNAVELSLSNNRAEALEAAGLSE